MIAGMHALQLYKNDQFREWKYLELTKSGSVWARLPFVDIGALWPF